MNPEQWLSLKWNGGSTMSDRWLNQSKIIHAPEWSVYKRKVLNRIAHEMKVKDVWQGDKL